MSEREKDHWNRLNLIEYSLSDNLNCLSGILPLLYVKRSSAIFYIPDADFAQIAVGDDGQQQSSNNLSKSTKIQIQI